MNYVILDASNQPLVVTNITSGMDTSTLTYPPLGTVGATATGEVGLKVIPLGGGAGGATNVAVISQVGAANQANAQVAASTTAGTLVAARATRRSVTIKNTDAAITVYVGAATVTAGNGMPLLAGESISVDTTALIQVISASGTPNVAYWEVYD